MERSKNTYLIMIAAGAALAILFVFFEYVMFVNGVFGDGIKMILIDSLCRAAFGIAAILVLLWFYKDRFKELFTHKIPKMIYILLLPVWLYFLVQLMYFFAADKITFDYLTVFLALCVQQIATGFYEEAACRGVIMGGMLFRFKDKMSGRLAMVITSGAIFGVAHFFNFLFGSSIDECLYQCLSSLCWGMFVAAIYMFSENLLLPMVIHAVWDIVVRIPGNFIEVSQTSILPDII